VGIKLLALDLVRFGQRCGFSFWLLAEVRTGARFTREKQVPRCARNDRQNGKSNGKSNGRNEQRQRPIRGSFAFGSG
jgi:hypothetical protein